MNSPLTKAALKEKMKKAKERDAYEHTMKLLQIKNEIIKREKDRKEKAYLKAFEATRNEAQHKVMLQIIKNATILNEKTRKEVAVLKAIEIKKGKQQLEAIELEAERIRTENSSSPHRQESLRNIPQLSGNVPTASGTFLGLLGTSEKSEDDEKIDMKVERIMSLKDQKVIVEELCRLNTVNAAKEANRRPKSVGNINGIDSHIDGERTLKSKLNETESRELKINDDIKQNSTSTLNSNLPVKPLDQIKKDLIEAEKEKKTALELLEEKQNPTSPRSAVAHATLVKETKPEIIKKIMNLGKDKKEVEKEVEDREEKDIVTLLPVSRTAPMLRE